LVEVLIGLLIVVLAVTLLATMIVGSTKVTSQNESVMKSLYEAESLLSSRSATVKNPDVTELRITGDTSTYSDSVAIEAYETDGFACYDLAVSKEGLNE
ncbi:MAG: hypothetical protein RR547_09845, partial [Raoultibacter sp.]